MQDQVSCSLDLLSIFHSFIHHSFIRSFSHSCNHLFIRTRDVVYSMHTKQCPLNQTQFALLKLFHESSFVFTASKP